MTPAGRTGQMLAVALLATAILLGCRASERSAYVEQNERLFQQLPPFPGATLESTTSTEARDEEDGPVVGYVTRFDLSLPEQATGELVASFYRERLRPQWRLVETLDGPVLNFRRGEACVSINLESWRSQILEVAVDHACTPS